MSHNERDQIARLHIDLEKMDARYVDAFTRAEKAEAENAALQADRRRLDWLESFVRQNGEIHLHDGNHPRGTGIGLATRTLRDAVDDAAVVNDALAAKEQPNV